MAVVAAGTRSCELTPANLIMQPRGQAGWDRGYKLSNPTTSTSSSNATSPNPHQTAPPTGGVQLSEPVVDIQSLHVVSPIPNTVILFQRGANSGWNELNKKRVPTQCLGQKVHSPFRWVDIVCHSTKIWSGNSS